MSVLNKWHRCFRLSGKKTSIKVFLMLDFEVTPRMTTNLSKVLVFLDIRKETQGEILIQL